MLLNSERADVTSRRARHGLVGYDHPLMRVLHRSRLTVLGVQFDALVRMHAEWALGIERFAELRDARLAGGVSPDLTMAEVIGAAGSTGLWRHKIQMTGKDGVLSWLSAMKVSRTVAGSAVEHLAACDPRSAQGVEAPEVVRWILDGDGEVGPAGLAPWDAERVDADGVAEIVAWLLDRERETPVVMVAVDNTSRARLVDVDELARRLAGMAAVVGLESVKASFRLRDALGEHGLSDMFGCFHGAVRIYWPKLARGHNPYDHPLVLQPKIMAAAPECRTEHVAGILGARLIEDVDAAAVLAEFEPRRAEPPRGARAAIEWVRAGRTIPGLSPRDWVPSGTGQNVLPGRSPEPAPRAATPRVAPPTTLPHTLPRSTPAAVDGTSALAQENETLRRALADAEKKLRAVEASLKATQDELAESRPDAEALAELAAEVEAVQSEANRVVVEERRARQRAEQERDEQAARLEPPSTVAAALALAEVVLGDRLVVLKSARASAEESPYREPKRVLDVLLMLTLAGTGDVDVVLKQVFGNAARWKPRDSPDTTRAFGAQRTWVGADGTKRLFTRHVTLGHGVDARTCLQVYYDVTTAGQIEVAWVGEHRPTVSVDT